MSYEAEVALRGELVARGWESMGYGAARLLAGAASPTGQAIVWFRHSGCGGRVYLWTEQRYDGPSVTIRRGSPRTAAEAISRYARTGELPSSERQAALPLLGVEP